MKPCPIHRNKQLKRNEKMIQLIIVFAMIAVAAIISVCMSFFLPKPVKELDWLKKTTRGYYEPAQAYSDYNVDLKNTEWPVMIDQYVLVKGDCVILGRQTDASDQFFKNRT